MMRQNIANICNELATGAGLDFEILRTYKIILEYSSYKISLYRGFFNIWIASLRSQ